MKYQKTYENSRYKELCMIGSLINSLEYVVEDLELKAIDVEYYGNGRALLRIHPYNLSEHVVSEVKSRVWGENWNINVEEYLSTLIIGDNVIFGQGFKELYYRFKDMIVEHVIPLMKKFTVETSRSNIEYYGALTNGSLYVFEGLKGKVKLPSFKAYATLHTHPQGVCMFSHIDIEHLIHMFSEGSLLSGVVTSNCTLIAYRVGPFTLDDYEFLLDLRDNVKKKKPIIKSIKYGKKLNVRFELKG